ncbi:MAG: response regulator transcription factor [Bacteroidota bacterium]
MTLKTGLYNFHTNTLIRRIHYYDHNKVKGDFTGNKDEYLTVRELEVLLGLCRGKTSQMIANELHISPKTIETYRANLLAKTHSNNLASLMMYSFISGLISTEVFT